MSAPEDRQEFVQRSSVEISLTAKGARQWRVKVYASDNTAAAADAALAKAIALDAELEVAYGKPA